MNEAERIHGKKKVAAAALLLMQQQEQAVLRVWRDYDNPSPVLEIIRSEQFDLFMKTVNLALSSGEIKRFLGVDSQQFNMIVSHCRPRERALRIPVSARLFIFLKFAREGRSENYLAKDIGISQPTVSRIVKEMTHDLVGVATQYIRFPSSLNEILALEHGFMSKVDSSGRRRRIRCFGSMDGKHWATEHPPDSGSLNANYKKFFSYNSLFVCDSDGRILFLQVSELGINNDAQLFRDSPLPSILENTVKIAGFRLLDDEDTILPPFLIADNGFGLSKHVMQPYRGELSTENMRFNWKLSAVRVKIENVFGAMNSKFQVFDRNLKLAPELSRSLIVALSVVHNIQLGTPPVYDADDGLVPMLSDPYNTPEEMRTALKNYVLKQ